MSELNPKPAVLSSGSLTDDPRFRITPYQQMAAACTGAVVTSLLMTPLDVVKVRLQAQQKSPSVVHKCFLYCNGLMDHICPCPTPSSPQTYWYSRGGQFSGTLVRKFHNSCSLMNENFYVNCFCSSVQDAFVKITRNEGISSLWSGLSPTLVLALPATVIYFVTYEQLRSRLKNFANRYEIQKSSQNLNLQVLPQPLWVPLVAGCTARIWSVAIVSPLELIRTKMQSEKLNYLQTNEAVRSLIHYHGIGGLWKGMLPTLLRDVPFSGIYWVTYEKIKSYTNQDGSSFVFSFIGGSISGAIAATVTTPFDVVKTLYQINFIDKEIMTGHSPTVLMTLKRIYETNGLPGLFSGIVPRLIKIVPACAIMVASFEFGKNYFHNRNLHSYLSKKQNVDKT
ncbi:probable mitochondrial glutathione transporter SLC25A40 isoform X2 [Planococcus citri]|uniref:probable mitochondrial glutathione transporter SLC25A40 isoform X2 n=1 Tax=Planococcus citri TaxID=170843 RepID=UPI0031FA4881